MQLRTVLGISLVIILGSHTVSVVAKDITYDEDDVIDPQQVFRLLCPDVYKTVVTEDWVTYDEDDVIDPQEVLRGLLQPYGHTDVVTEEPGDKTYAEDAVINPLQVSKSLRPDGHTDVVPKDKTYAETDVIDPLQVSKSLRPDGHTDVVPKDKTYAETDVIDPQQVSQLLQPDTYGVKSTRKSAINSPINKTTPANTSNNRVANKPKRPNEFNVPVKFASNSDKILPKSLPLLDAVGMIIETTGVTVVIEAHTEAKGSAAANLALSKRQAEAVKRLFMERHGISSDLLLVEGKGSTEPLNPHKPKAAENQRIHIRRAADPKLASNNL